MSADERFCQPGASGARVASNSVRSNGSACCVQERERDGHRVIELVEIAELLHGRVFVVDLDELRRLAG
jgi:hypothetical protein